MSDPERIIHGPDEVLAAELLRALRREAPPAHARARALKMLGIPAGAAGTMAGTAKAAATSFTVGSGQAASTWTTALVLKWSVTGIGIAAIAVGATQWLSRPTPAQHAVVTVGSVHRALRAPARPLLESPAAVAPTEVSGAASAPVSTRARATRSTSGSISSTATTESSSLASEVELLDKARAANAAHDPARTLQLLNRYQRQFSRGILAPEAQLLRLEALVQSGRRSEALPLARQMLKVAPTGPHAERIITLLPSAQSGKTD